MIPRNDFSGSRGSLVANDEDYRREVLEHVRDLKSDPAAVQQEALEQAALIARAVGCPECAAPTGEPCRGLAIGSHFDRALAYART